MAINYVFSEPYFWPSMAFTTMIAIFIGSVIYDGDLSEIKKMLVSLLAYSLLLVVANYTRIAKDLPIVTSPKPLAFLVTLIVVSIFYVLGTFIGAWITKRAHKDRQIPC